MKQLPESNQNNIWKWIADRLDGKNESITKHTNKAATFLSDAPLKVLGGKGWFFSTGNEAQMSGPDWIDKRTKQAGDFGEKYVGTAGKVVAGGVGRIAASTAMLVHGAVVGVPMLAAEITVAACVTALYLAPKRAIGTATLFGNLLRKKIFQNIEDKLSPSVSEEKIKDIYRTYEEDCNKINPVLFEKIKDKTDSIANAKTPEKLSEATNEYKKFIEESYTNSPQDKELLQKMDKESRKVIDNVQKFIKTQERTKTRDSHDKSLSKVPGVKEVRKHIKDVYSTLSNVKEAVTSKFSKKNDERER